MPDPVLTYVDFNGKDKKCTNIISFQDLDPRDKNVTKSYFDTGDFQHNPQCIPFLYGEHHAYFQFASDTVSVPPSSSCDYFGSIACFYRQLPDTKHLCSLPVFFGHRNVLPALRTTVWEVHAFWGNFQSGEGGLLSTY